MGFSSKFSFSTLYKFEEYLNMGKYLYNTQLQDDKKSASSDPKKKGPPVILFRLQSMIEHSGLINSGHYVAFRRGPAGSRSEKKWFKISDTNVEPCDLENVLASKAYLLFYERASDMVDPGKSSPLQGNQTLD